MADTIPVEFIYKGQQYKGVLDRIKGAGYEWKFHLSVDGLHFAQLFYSPAQGRWYCYTGKGEDMNELVNQFEDTIIAWYQ